MTHKHSPEHEHEHPHGSGHAHDGTEPHTHDQAPDASGTGAGTAGGLDRERLRVLLRNWVDHNEGHRRSYLEWRDRLAGEHLPISTAAMERLATLAEEANVALRGALDELGPE